MSKRDNAAFDLCRGRWVPWFAIEHLLVTWIYQAGSPGYDHLRPGELMWITRRAEEDGFIERNDGNGPRASFRLNPHENTYGGHRQTLAAFKEFVLASDATRRLNEAGPYQGFSVLDPNRKPPF